MTGRHSLRVPMPPPEPTVNEAIDFEAERPSTRWEGRWPLILAILLGVLAFVGGVIATRSAGEVEDQRDINAVQRDAAADQAANLGRDVVAACARGEIVQTGDGRDLCQRAAQVQSTPVPGVPIQGDPGPGPTPEQIEAAVVSYCAARDECSGRPPSTEEVAAAVAQYLTANPPQPGRPPTPAEIAEQVRIYFANNPPPEGRPGRDGVDGATGAPGRPPTQEEIEAAVAAYLAENPPPPGPACQPGTTLQTVQFADGQFGLACVFDEQPDPDPEPTTQPPAPTTTPTTDMDDGGLFGG